ncbi:MAG: acyltransferase [Boseongicola sp. SB0662_bin_57]|nr:acyltransferase [Boseongicola sp. SB0662_bin_57]
MKARLKLARVGMNMEGGTISKWHVAAGDQFRTGDVLYEVETEKVSSEAEAPGDGVMIEVLVREGEVAAVGQDVCIVESA